MNHSDVTFMRILEIRNVLCLVVGTNDDILYIGCERKGVTVARILPFWESDGLQLIVKHYIICQQQCIVPRRPCSPCSGMHNFPEFSRVLQRDGSRHNLISL